MRLSTKLLLSTLVPPALIWAVGFYVERVSEENLRQAIDEVAKNEVQGVQEEIDRLLWTRATTWQAYAKSAHVQRTLRESNAKFRSYDNPVERIIEMDELWTSTDPVEAEVMMRPYLENPLSEDLRATLNKYSEVAGYEVFGEVFLTNSYGANVAQSGMTTDYLQCDEEWWFRAEQDGLYIGEVAFDESAGILSVEICARVDGDNSEFLGVLKAVMNIREIFEIVDSHARRAGPDLALITSDARVIRIGNRETPALSATDRYEVIEDYSVRAGTVTRHDERTGEELIFTYALPRAGSLVEGLQWVVVKEAMADEVLAPVRRLRDTVIVISVIGTVVGIAVMGWIVLPVSRRIARVADATSEIGKGNYDTKIVVRGRDELSRLSTEFNRMTDSLEGAHYDLLVARDIAEDASRVKGDFLANMSHEIRTPMNAILGMTELTLGTALTEEQREYQNLVEQSAEALLALLNDILDYSKIEAGKLKLEEYEFGIRDSLGDILQTLAPRASDKALELALQVDRGVPDLLRGDLGRLRQVIVNLVGNAIKFTERGEILVRVAAEKTEGERIKLHFMVSDTGIGVPEDRRKEIFESFSQGDSSTTRKYGGTGLGLAISRRISEKMGGRIWVESEVGVGSTFHFTGLFEVAPEQENAQPVPASLRGASVLVVDDNEMNRRVLGEMLEGWGLRAVPCESGEAALAKLDEIAVVDGGIRVALLDRQMPGLDGLELAKRIRDLAAWQDLPMIMMGAVSGPRPAVPLEDIGVVRSIIKPVKQSVLLDSIMRGLGLSSGESTPDAAADGQRPRNVPVLRLLLAEDGMVNQVVAVRLLERRGHEVTVVENGLLAVDALEDGEFDVILMDVQMPVMNGFEATAAIREREAAWGGHVPIIAMTAHAMPGDREECLAAGMDDYIAKPIEPRELYSVVENVAGVGSGKRFEKGNGRKPRGNEVVFDAERFQERFVDQQLMRELIDIFGDDCGQLLENLRAAEQGGDAEEVHRAAHGLKGVAGNYCADRTEACATELDARARRGDLGGLNGMVEVLSEEVVFLKEALRQFGMSLEPPGPGRDGG